MGPATDQPFAPTSVGTTDASLRLYVAAPDMLVVLRDVAALLPLAHALHPDDLFDLQSRIVAAIAKAEG